MLCSEFNVYKIYNDYFREACDWGFVVLFFFSTKFDYCLKKKKRLVSYNFSGNLPLPPRMKSQETNTTGAQVRDATKRSRRNETDVALRFETEEETSKL